MIETNYFILPLKIYQKVQQDAKELGVNLDHYLMEFCDVEGETVYK